MNLVLIINLLEKAQLLKLISRIKGESDEEERKKSNCREVEVQTDEYVFPSNMCEDILLMDSVISTDDSGPGDDFNILDITKDDLVLTPGGPKPIEDYTTFIPGSIVSPDYINPLNTDNLSCGGNSTEVSMAHTEDLSSMDEESISNLSVGEDLNESIQNIVTNENLDISQMENLIKKKTKQDMVSLYLQNSSEYFKKFPHQIKNCSKQMAGKFDREDPNFPSGWKVKVTYRNNPNLSSRAREIREYLSPEFKIFRSKVAVVEYMRAMGGYSHREMNSVLPMKIKKEKV